MTISELIAVVNRQYSKEIEVCYVHPTLYVLCVSEIFKGKKEEERKMFFFSSVGVKDDEIFRLGQNSLVEIVLITPEERADEYSFLDSADSGRHWLGAFSPIASHLGCSNAVALNTSRTSTKAIHFYGYKGGQARSTVLLAFAKMLADAKFKVLIVDADIEAPSIDAMLNIVANETRQTIMGLCENNTEIHPITRAYVGKSNAGQIDVITARPVSSNFDMDFAAFLLGSSLDPKILEAGVVKLRAYVNELDADGAAKYDVVLFDHRTGLAPSVLPIMEAWPGSAVIFIRPDGMARHIKESKLLDLLLGYNRKEPGAFVSFSLKAKQTSQLARAEHTVTIDNLLEKMSDALTKSDDGSTQDLDDIDPAELERYWVFWKHDDDLADGKHPAPSALSMENRSALSQLRAVLGLSSSPNRISATALPKLTFSGSSDEGQFILTPDIAKLFSLDSPYNYIFGRKGTGKTRLLSELCKQKLGRPLLVAADSKEGGLQSGGTLFQQVLGICNKDFETFWWFLLHSALNLDTSKELTLNDSLRDVVRVGIVPDLKDIISGIENSVDKISSMQVFLVDGVETAVPAANLRSFVESLFRFLAAIQFNRSLSNFITVRLFLRLDLSKGSAQNIEQQIEGHVLQLHWKKTAILNFALARIISLPWFVENFSAVCEEISENIEQIALGNLEDDKAEQFLLKIFPEGLERNKVKTTTFFSTYFSDAGGDSDRNATFYPRLFDGFLKKLAEKCDLESSLQMTADERLPSRIVLEAYDEASRDFIGDVRVELYSFLDIEEGDSENKQAVDNLIQAFSGLRTPFVTESIIPELSRRANIGEDKVRQALRSMQAVGIFEDRPAYPGELRTGRLYKAGLAMKYGRKKDTATENP